MTSQHPLYTRVALAEDLPEYHLKRGEVARIVEYYPMPDGQEDGYSLEGFDVPHVTVEVGSSKIISVEQYQQEEAILIKLRQLSSSGLGQIEDFIDFLLQKEMSQKEVA
jgi:hypothetical protein